MSKRTKQQRIEDYVKKMQAIASDYDCETAHADADTLLCELLIELGYKQVVDIYNKVCKWYA